MHGRHVIKLTEPSHLLRKSILLFKQIREVAVAVINPGHQRDRWLWQHSGVLVLGGPLCGERVNQPSIWQKMGQPPAQVVLRGHLGCR